MAGLPFAVSAHTVGQTLPAFPLWSPDALAVIGLLLAAMLYAGGLRRLWRNAHAGAGVRPREAACFASGIAILAVALLSPLDALGAQLFAAHMAQHELIMLAAAPLLVLGRPLPVFLWAFAHGGRARIARAVRAGAVRHAWHILTAPFCAWSLHAAVLWAWHAPALFQAGLASNAAHAVQHAAFLLSALLFWSSLLGPQSRMRSGMAVLYLLSTAIHTGVLGALLTFSPRVWYPAYLDTAPAWGWSALEDQQLGGLIMWVPAGFVLVAAGLALAARTIAPVPERQP